MYTHNLAYRHSNGEIEGFSFTALSDAATAERLCRASMVEKVTICHEHGTGHPFDESRVIHSDVGLPRHERARLRRDWRV